MAKLTGLIVGDDDFRSHIARQLRSGAVPVSVIEDHMRRDGVFPDVIVVDVRGDAASAMAEIERLRGTSPGAAICAVASSVGPEVILQAMRAGANEFLTWPPEDNVLHDAIRRTASRREGAQGARPAATTLVFFGAKGGAGTTTIAVNCGVELARLSKRPTVIVDLKRGVGEVALFLGLRPRFSLLDAIDNLHRLDSEFLRELVIKHKSTVDILSGSENFDRPGANDGNGIEELLQVLARHYAYVVVDAGSEINSCTVAALYAADTMFLVANPDVPSVRNAQRLLERVRQVGACGERARILLNRAAEPYPIPPKQIESALGHPIHHMFPSDYKTVATALNSGVPIAQSGGSEVAAQFGRFTRQILDPAEGLHAAAMGPRSLLGLGRIASLW